VSPGPGTGTARALSPRSDRSIPVLLQGLLDDRDGDLDLFVSRYVKIDLANLPEFGKGKTCEYCGVAVQCGPRGLPGEGDFLFRNDGNGRFTEARKPEARTRVPTSAWASPGST
jgi:hypothetical protein